jgi:hypothetical protein
LALSHDYLFFAFISSTLIFSTLSFLFCFHIYHDDVLFSLLIIITPLDFVHSGSIYTSSLTRCTSKLVVPSDVQGAFFPHRPISVSRGPSLLLLVLLYLSRYLDTFSQTFFLFHSYHYISTHLFYPSFL